MTSPGQDAELHPPLLTVVVPCFNEAATLRTLLERVLELAIPLEVIVVDDGSTDGSRDILKEVAASEPRVRIALHEHNQGKGAALSTGFRLATGVFVVVQDADLEYNPLELPRLLKPALLHGAEVVYGSRFVGSGAHRVVYYWHSVANRMLTQFSNVTTNINLTDMETCYKLFRREIIQAVRLEEKRFGVEPEVTAKVARMGCVIYEVGISYAGRTYEEGKKIGFRDAVRAVYCIGRYGTSRRVPKPKLSEIPRPYAELARRLALREEGGAERVFLETWAEVRRDRGYAAGIRGVS